VRSPRQQESKLFSKFRIPGQKKFLGPSETKLHPGKNATMHVSRHWLLAILMLMTFQSHATLGNAPVPPVEARFYTGILTGPTGSQSKELLLALITQQHGSRWIHGFRPKELCSSCRAMQIPSRTSLAQTINTQPLPQRSQDPKDYMRPQTPPDCDQYSQRCRMNREAPTWDACSRYK
jgi:hypothetical protein